MKTILSFLLLFSLSAHADPFAKTWIKASDLSEISRLAIQSNGRVKPFDTFAREGMELLTGHERFNGKSPVELILSMIFEPQEWGKVEFIQINHQKLKRDLELPVDRKYFTPDEVSKSVRLMPLFQEVSAKLEAKEKLDPYFQAVQTLGNQTMFLQELINGHLLRFAPPTKEEYNKSDAWKSVDQLSNELQLRFTLIGATFVNSDPAIHARFPEHVKNFHNLMRERNPALYPADSAMNREILLAKVRPFRWAWIFSLLGALVLGFALYSAAPAVYWTGMGFAGASFLLQAFGFVLRCLIAGRPPVSNMFESILWVSFGALLFGLVLESIYRKRVIGIGALICATIGLIVADNISGVLDAGIQPLEPVLRSNYWLTIHVLTITLGYAAFFLSLILGNIGLAPYVFAGKESPRLPVRLVSFYAYRAVQVGVVLLAAGTILGGVWADYSWGRFWGWDPKETWALIALLGYLALIHARFRGLVGHVGFLAGCVVSFLGVLMAWYGVNFVLGAGLHSYGFGSGGLSYMATYATAQLVFVVVALAMRRRAVTLPA